MACEGQFEDLIKSKWLLTATIAEAGLIKVESFPDIIQYRNKLFEAAKKKQAITSDKRTADEIINNVFGK